MGAAAYGGRGFKARAQVSGERPMGAATCRQQHNRASPPPPLPPNVRALCNAPLPRASQVCAPRVTPLPIPPPPPPPTYAMA